MDILNSDNDAVIVNATVNLAHNLGLQVTAEGVENEAILEQLKTCGCDVAQGYLFNKPLNREDFSALIRQAPWGVADAPSP